MCLNNQHFLALIIQYKSLLLNIRKKNTWYVDTTGSLKI